MRNDRPDYRPSFIAVPLAIPVAIAYRSTARRPVSDSRGKKRPYQNRLLMAVLYCGDRDNWTDRLAGNGARTDSIRRHRGAETLAHAPTHRDRDRDTARAAGNLDAAVNLHSLPDLYAHPAHYNLDAHLRDYTYLYVDALPDLYAISGGVSVIYTFAHR